MARKRVGIRKLLKTDANLERVLGRIVDRKNYLVDHHRYSPGLRNKNSLDDYIIFDRDLNELYNEADRLAKILVPSRMYAVYTPMG